MLGVVLAVAIVAGAASAWAYQSAVLAVPPVVVALGLFAALPGVLIAATAFRLRYRGRVLLVVFAVLAGLAADAASWAVALRHARRHDLVWVESETDAFLRRGRSSKTATDVILGRHDILTEEGRMAYEELLSAPSPPERLSETVRAPTPLEYADFRLRRGWPERGHEATGLVVGLAWSGAGRRASTTSTSAEGPPTCSCSRSRSGAGDGRP
jgi:hypothetical protein